MLYFGIPLKPRRFSRNWEQVVANFHTTLRSVLNQSDPNFRVVVACSDELPQGPRDPRVEFIHVPPAPSVSEPGEWDRRWRVWSIGQYIRERGGGAVMMVDADDLVSCRIAAFANSHAEGDGYIARTGYELDDRTGRLRWAPRFWNLCGTCAVTRVWPDDIPDVFDRHFPETVYGTQHQHLRRRFQSWGRTLRWFPFPVAVYRVFTGDNLRELLGDDFGWKHQVLRRLIPSRRPTPEQRREFWGEA
ncbi:MAG: glycosyltransferase [Myxococcota bacterium]